MAASNVRRLATLPVLRYALAALTALALVALLRAPAVGQGARDPAAMPTPRAADGKPDLSGRWGASRRDARILVVEADGTEIDFETFAAYQDALVAGEVSTSARILGRLPNYRHGNNVYAERDGGMVQRYFANPPLYKAEYWDRVEYLDVNGNVEDMTFICMPAGVPRMGPPIRIVQTQDDVVLLYQQRNTWRVVPTDGRAHDPLNSEDQTFMGDSVGRWEGDTLVIDVIGFNDLTWLGWPGWFHTNEMRVEERFTRVGNTLRYDVTVHDPAVLIEPWVADTRELQLDQSTAPYLEDPPCLDFDSAHMVTRERG
ncbi:MAG: hypothetical protein HKN84_04340 [Gammaproteobacteria bacterium]|nr:hypothetical protein [Gammaproteobacteria bacterium]